MKSTLNRAASDARNYLITARRKMPVLPFDEGARTLFADVQRRIVIYLRAMWGREFQVKLAPPDARGGRVRTPYVEDGLLFLPDYCCDLMQQGRVRLSGLDTYRAAAAHAAAHVVYSGEPLILESYSKWQRAVISVIEDARVETLAIRRFPGLGQLWRVQHTAQPSQQSTAGDYLNRLARALLDERYVDDDPWVVHGRALFAAVPDLEGENIARDIGLELAFELNIKRMGFCSRTDVLVAPYRDDHRCLWLSEFSGANTELPSSLLRFKRALLQSDDVTNEGDRAGRSTVLATRRPQSGKSLSGPYGYGEWDFRSQTETPAWVTLREMPSVHGDLQLVRDIIAQHSDLAQRMKTMLSVLRQGSVRRIRKLEEGDEIDVNAAIRSQVDLRSGVQPDPRIMMRTVRRSRDISVLVLLDLSQSMNEKIAGQSQSVLDLTRQVCVLFAGAMETVGDPFAIHGFCSESRHFVEYYRMKDFDAAYDDESRAKIAGMTAQRATRMGAAVRHATHLLEKQKSNKKLLMIITDGAPSDVDVRGREYLIHDTKQSVDKASRSGVDTYCISLDPKADEYVARIFGARNYIVIDHIGTLPEKMLMLYAGLTR